MGDLNRRHQQHVQYATFTRILALFHMLRCVHQLTFCALKLEVFGNTASRIKLQRAFDVQYHIANIANMGIPPTRSIVYTTTYQGSICHRVQDALVMPGCDTYATGLCMN